MMQGLYQYMKERKEACKGYANSIIIVRQDMVVFMAFYPDSIFVHTYLLKPMTTQQWINHDNFIKEYPTRGRKLYHCYANFTFA